jgi:hypothetical protein
MAYQIGLGARVDHHPGVVADHCGAGVETAAVILIAWNQLARTTDSGWLCLEIGWELRSKL